MMSILPDGSTTLVKLTEIDGREEFMILFVDPKRAARAGYSWTTTGPLLADEARDALAKMGVPEAEFPRLFTAARQHFNSQPGPE